MNNRLKHRIHDRVLGMIQMLRLIDCIPCPGNAQLDYRLIRWIVFDIRIEMKQTSIVVSLKEFNLRNEIIRY